MLKIDGKDTIELDLRAMIYRYLYKVYDIHFLNYDIKVVGHEDLDFDILENGCHVYIQVEEHKHE